MSPAATGPRSDARITLIIGGARSGKSQLAEKLAAEQKGSLVYIATAEAWDEEMRERIARHRRDRAERVPRMRTVEEPLALAQAIGRHSRPDTLIVVDCLTLWLTALLMPAVGQALDGPAAADAPPASLAGAVAACAGPLVLISNEIGLGVVPLGRDVRTFVDALGTLNQLAAAACERVTLMSAGIPLTLKGSA